jgi:hypothetical protein
MEVRDPAGKAASAALADGTGERLVAELVRDAGAQAGFRDWRDVLIGFAPFYDCARRLGLDPAGVFDDAARQVPDDVADLLRTFGRRTDVTLGAFGYVFEDGTTYRFALWPAKPPRPQ